MTGQFTEDQIRALPTRDTARLIVLDPDRRLLLIRYQAVAAFFVEGRPQHSFWYTPGGGLEPGEAHQEAARRELFEETGIVDFELGPHVASWNAPLLLFKRQSFTRARFYLVRARDAALDISRLAETEDDPVLDIGWWDLAALAESREPLVPPTILPLAMRLASGWLPDAPLDLAHP